MDGENIKFDGSGDNNEDDNDDVLNEKSIFFKLEIERIGRNFSTPLSPPINTDKPFNDDGDDLDEISKNRKYSNKLVMMIIMINMFISRKIEKSERRDI